MVMNLRGLVRAVVSLMLIAVPALATSTIDPTQPLTNMPYSSAPIRNNFQAAYNDINALQTCNAGVTAPSAPQSGYCWLDTSGGNTAWVYRIYDGITFQWVPFCTLNATAGNASCVAAVSVTGLVTVLSNASLKALSVTGFSAGTAVFRAGFATPGDGGAATYTFSSGNCAIVGGDNGAQVQSTAGAGCWNVVAPPQGLSFKVWGAKFDGSTNDAAADQAALNWAGAQPGGALQIPPGAISYVLTAIADNGLPVIIHGNNPTNGNDNGICTSGFTDVVGGVAGNINLLTLNGTGSKIDHTCFLMGTNVNQATSGTALTIGAASGQIAVNQASDWNTIKFPYIGIAVGGQTGGSFGGGTNSPHIFHNWVVSPSQAGITIGANSQGASTVADLIEDNRVTCGGALAQYAVEITDAAIDTYSGNELTQCNVGTGIVPGAAQIVLGFFSNVLGDSNVQHELLIKPTAANARVIYTTFSNWWVGMNTNQTGSGILIEGDTFSPPSFVHNIVFTGGTAHGSATTNNTAYNIFDIEGCVSGLTINGNTIAEDGNAGVGQNLNTGIFYNGTCAGTVINGNNMVPNQGTMLVGLNIASSATGDDITYTNNNAHTATTPILFGPTTVNFRANISGNYPDAQANATVAPATALVIDPSYSSFFMTSGTGPSTTMTPFWQTRYVRLRPVSSGYQFQTGGGTGGFCNAITTSFGGQMVEAWWNPNSQCWDLK